MVRTLVAVGIEIDASMLAARVFGMPLRMVTWSVASSSTMPIDEVTGACAGIGVGFASTRVVFATRTGLGSPAAAAGAAATGAAAGVGVLTAGAAAAAGAALADPAREAKWAA
jgi:hypothetical protein